ncbi:uncharacterized protein (DUF983 family) [Thermonema lapsum]|uniref:Uncharacterized protein (DUF983 family) n=1 Tax=Thermonema lapsum TaxID=28195 RepID=A0A846MP27_9BACT|nr:DUF983 domain-containing protein [Thermonema lapsum]NIK73087.1 uncharacterized protein (DUF983 family) [Thermonema lapsum]
MDNPKHKGYWQSLAEQRCPHCREGKLFKYPAYSRKFMEMYEECPHCGIRYEREPGFFYGAMYVSYAFQVALFVTVLVALNLLIEEPPIWAYFAGVLIPLFLLYPLFFRYARTLYLYFFSDIKYDPEAAQKAKASQ